MSNNHTLSSFETLPPAEQSMTGKLHYEIQSYFSAIQEEREQIISRMKLVVDDLRRAGIRGPQLMTTLADSADTILESMGRTIRDLDVYRFVSLMLQEIEKGERLS